MDKHLRILLLEDIPIDAELVERELQKAKFLFIIKRVASRAKFEKELEAFAPNLILADYTLPQFNGLEALRLVKERGLDIPFILVTGMQKEETAVECMKEGADDYILKTSLRRLPGAILNALDKKEAGREKHRLEDELQKSTKQIITIFESITDAFFALDNEWRFMYLNPRCDQFLSKVHKRREDLWGKFWWDEFPMPEDSAGFKLLLKAMMERVPAQFEEFYPSLNSWLHIRAYPAEEGLSIYAQDITGRKRIEKLQRAVYEISEAASSEAGLDELFRRIHEIIGDLMPAKNVAIALRDKQTQEVTFPYFVNEKEHVPSPESTSSRLTKHVLSSGEPLLLSPQDEAATVGVAEFDCQDLSCIDWLGVPLKTAKGVIGVLSVQSYTEGVRFGEREKEILLYVSKQVAMAIERKRAEEKIREQAYFLETAQDAIVVFDLKNRIIYWNRGAEAVYGWMAEDVLGRYADVLSGQPDEIATVLEHLAVKDTWIGEMRQSTKEGREVTVSSRWSLVRNEDGAPRSILMIATDITDKKKLEQQFLRAQRLESIGTLASGLAHDLNNVLSPIIMAIPILKEKLSEEPDLDILRTLEISAKRGEGIVKQVLSFVRGVEGARTTLQVKHLVVEVGNFLRETLPPSVHIQTKLMKNLWLVQGDATQLYQVFVNLAVNARDAMPDGGVLRFEIQNVDMDGEAATMHIDARPGRYIVVTVSDTGSGIQPDMLNRIFDPFFTTKDPGMGTGLGLFTVLTIVKGHGGFVDVHSDVGKGTEFKVYIPATETSETGEIETAARLPNGNGQYILVVDDEECVNGLIQTTLKSRNYNVLSAKDGSEALAMYVQHKDEIEVVLMDLLMPFLDGPATLRAMQKIDPHVKVIAMSGMLAGKQWRAEAFDGGKVPFLQKPFSSEQLLAAVHEVLAEQVEEEAHSSAEST